MWVSVLGVYVALCRVELCSPGKGAEDVKVSLTSPPHSLWSNFFTSGRGNPVLMINSPGTKPMSLKPCHLLRQDKEALSRWRPQGKHRKVARADAQAWDSMCPPLRAENPW